MSAEQAKIEHSRKQLEDEISKWQPLVDASLGEFDPNFTIATPRDPSSLPRQQSLVVQAQHDDEICQQLFNSDPSDFKEKAKQLFGDHGHYMSLIKLRAGKYLLVHRKKDDKAADPKERWVIPPSALRKVLRCLHGDGFYHMSADTMDRVSDHCWWPDKRDGIRNYVRNCPKCSEHCHYSEEAPPRSIYTDSRGESIAMDLLFVRDPQLGPKERDDLAPKMHPSW